MQIYTDYMKSPRLIYQRLISEENSM